MVRESELSVNVQETVHSSSGISTPVVDCHHLHRIGICRVLDRISMDVPPTEHVLPLWYVVDESRIASPGLIKRF